MIRIAAILAVLCTLGVLTPGDVRAADALGASLGRLIEEGRVPAAAVVIVGDDGAARYLLFGGGVRKDTPFRWGSITKTFTGLALMKAAEEANVSLAVPLSDVVPQQLWRNAFTDYPVRLEHLLEMTSGLPDLSGRAFDDNRVMPLARALVEHGDSLVVRWQPGLAHSYSNATMGLTELAVQSLADEPFAAALARLVLRPLGMPSASLEPLAGLPGGFKADGVTPIPYWNMTFRGFGALNASIEEMSQLLRALLGWRDRPWSEAVHARLWRPHTGLDALAGLPVGYGAGIYGRVRDGWLWHGHGGDADGYRSRYGVLRDLRMGYAVVINVDNPKLLEKLVRTIEAVLVAGQRLPGEPDLASLVTLDQAWTGGYYPVASRFGVERLRSGKAQELRLRVDGRSVVIELGARSHKLLHVGGGLLTRSTAELAEAALVRVAQRSYLTGTFGTYVKRD
jgi:CubicO group peptidase (beta-lactamase class C family)